MSHLRCVSLTGADDQTDVRDLAELGAQYSFVEWALLYVPHKEGAPRNPTQGWRTRFFEANVPGSVAMHLCGRLAFEQLRDSQLPLDVLQADRLQLNINARGRDFEDVEVLDLFQCALALGPDIILQYHEDSARVIHQFLATVKDSERTRVHVLLDGSRGTGVCPPTWTVPEELSGWYCGSAGGIGPTTIDQVLASHADRTSAYWVDMESGIRTDNRFDLEKARRVLSSAAAFRAGV